MSTQVQTSDLVQWNKVKGLERSNLGTLIDKRRELKEAQEALAEQLSAVNNKILKALATVDVKSVAVGDTRVTLVSGGQSEKLDKKKLWGRLLELGVKEKVVVTAYADCTTVEPRNPYVLVTEPKEEGERV